MKFSKLIKYIILPAIGMCICLNWYFAYAYSSGPPVGYTNAPKDCGNCTSCHSTVSLKSKSARIKLSGITGGYAANDTFHMVLTYLNSVSAKGHLYGFEVVVLDSATKKNMGTIKVTDKTNTGSSSSSGCSGASRTYIYQTSSGTKAAISKNWKFDWIAPSTTTGTAIFYTIINSANGDASDGGDTIFAQEFHYKAVSKLVAGFKCASSVCTGDSLAITDTSKGTPTSWSWTFQNGSPSTSTLKNPKVAFSASGSDTITLVAKNASSTSTKIFVVTVNSAPVASITPSTTSSVCWGDSVLFTSSSGSSYLWSNGAKTQSIYVKDSQSYTVIVTNSSGCSTKSSPLSVSYITPPVAKITAAASSICPGDSVLLSASSGASYLWSNGDTTQTIYVKDSLPYTVTVSNSSGCSVKSSPLKIKLNVPVAKITPASTLGICSGDSILLTASSASSYLWSTGAVSQSIYVKDSLPYTVKVTNSSGCSASSSPFKVKINTPSATIKASTSSPICDGDSVLLTASSGSSYVWSNGATTQSIYVKDSLAYSVKINGTPGCGATSNSIKIQINALPSANITPGTTSAICQGDSVQLSASSGSTYLWSNGAKTQSIYVKDSLAYKVKVTNSSGCSATSSPAKIKINALPKVSITPAKSSVCVGDSVLLTATSGSSYSWSNGSTSQTIYVKDSLSYTVNVSNSSGCSATSVPVKIKINSLPLASITPASSSICSGDSVLLSASPGSSFLWSNGATSKSIYVKDSTPYSVTVTNASGCSAMSSSLKIKVNALPVASITPSSSSAICKGDSIMFTASSGSSYLWSNGGKTQSIYVKDSLPYTVKVTNVSGCSASSKPEKISLNPVAIASITSSASSMCLGDSMLLTASSNSSYQWSNGATSQSIYVKDSLPYAVKVINASGCNATSSPAKITINPLPKVSLTANKNGKYCKGDTAILTSNPSGYLTYVFGKNKSLLSSSGNTASFDASTILSSDVYSVAVTDKNGCPGLATNLKLSYAAPLSPGFTFSNNKASVSYTDTTSGGSGRSWDFGDGSSADTSMKPVHVYANSSTYKVILTVYNSNGCADTISRMVSVLFTGIQNNTFLTESSIYPNPSRDQLTVSINSMDEQKLEIVIQDMLGRKYLLKNVALLEGPNTIALSLEGITPGNYILLLKGKQEIKYFNLVKIK